MSIAYCRETGVFTLRTRNSMYQMKVAEYGVLLHLYYGRPAEGDFSYLVHRADHGFSGNPHEAGDDRTFSLDTLPQEYSGCGVGDFRTASLSVTHPNGSTAVDLRYVAHEIVNGKPPLRGLPAIYCGEDEAKTLLITMKDSATDTLVILQYSVLEQWDVITRSCQIVNRTRGDLRLNAALSCCLDFMDGNYDLISFYGRHAMERTVERAPLRHGKHVIDSMRGASSHQQNPFVILCEPDATEQSGACYGMSFVYSGNFAATAELDQLGQTRLTMGIHPAGFSWRLAPGGSFQTPETVLCYSAEGLGGLSRAYHRVFRERLCRGEWRDRRRPVLINNWEATYFDFDDDKLVRIAEEAAGLGIEMLVVDDGWFGKRNDDRAGLGDWRVNPQKIRGGLAGLCERIQALGLRLGIWFEPEMVSQDSDLYRAHPDWCLLIPGRSGCRARYQYVLDLSRREVEDYLYDAISAVLGSADIAYVKWDMNRHLTDVWSAALPAERQGETHHRYVLALYRLLDRLEERFPHVLFEGCSGGGGRFDAGMLYYTPQIWCSDNTDAIERIRIQYGTSFGYPVSTMGAHVSASPNHQTGRATPFHTRGAVAMTGAFGYELDPEALTAEEKREIQRQVAFYRRHWKTVAQGDYYRLTDPTGQTEDAAWQFVNREGTESLVTYVSLAPKANAPAVRLKLRGLNPMERYRVQKEGEPAGCYSGSALLYAGLLIPPMQGDYVAVNIEIQRLPLHGTASS